MCDFMHVLIHVFYMMTLIFGDLVYNELGPPLISQQVREFRKSGYGA